MEQWDVSHCVRRSSPYPIWAAPTPDLSRWPASAVRSGCVMTARKRISWRRSLAKTRWLRSWRKISPTGMSSLQLSKEDLRLCLVRKHSVFHLFAHSWRVNGAKGFALFYAYSIQTTAWSLHVRFPQMYRPNHTLVPVLQDLWNWHLHQGDQQQQRMQAGQRNTTLRSPAMHPITLL